MRGWTPEVFEVTGGSLFCECKVTDFIENLEAIHQFFETTDRALKGVVIETSGIADPEVMAKLLGKTGMADKSASPASSLWSLPIVLPPTSPRIRIWKRRSARAIWSS